VSEGPRGAIRIGIGGWSYAPWRGPFYPDGLAQKEELAYAARQLSSIEINATFYRSQKPESFARWHDETPEDFVFAVKGPRFATTRPVLAEAGASIERFFASGVLALKDKLGPINWQLMPTKRFDPEDFAAFLRLLPKTLGDRALRHSVEVRHDSFLNAELVAVAREHDVAIVVAADSRYPQIADITAPFVYVRIMGTQEAEPLGYVPAALDLWAERLRTWNTGRVPADLSTFAAQPANAGPLDVYAYLISGHKVRNPAAAVALIERLGRS
jgi:uncharacterized protein YecE (DUF72 family)